MPPLPLTISEAADALRARRLSSLELTDALLDRATASQETVAAFITLTPEKARAAARQADADFAAGVDRGPLQGIPLGIKDIICTTEAPTTANSNVLDRAWGAGRDATVTKQLKAAGAVIVGKLGLNEFALGFPDPATGFRIPKNPWNLAHQPGGSSSGTGAAVAAGLILGGLGTDTGGSIRGPAAYCGISGIKATFGRVSKEGCVPLGYSLDNIGPMARSARDCALLLQILAGHDPADPCTLAAPVPDMTASLDGSLAGVRLGVPRRYFFDVPELQPEVKAAVEAAIEAMRQAGASVRAVDIPHAAEGRAAQWLTMLAEAYTYHEPDLQTRPELYGRYTRMMFQRGAFFSAADYVNAQRVRALTRAESAAALADVDVLVTPTMLMTAPPFAGWDPDAIMTAPSFMGLWNLVGFPALSIPCGFGANGLPIGMQLIGAPLAEPTVFKVADAYQQITDYHRQLSPVAKEMEQR